MPNCHPLMVEEVVVVAQDLFFCLMRAGVVRLDSHHYKNQVTA